MPQKDPTQFFDEKHAANYDQRYARISPVRDCLHLLIRLVLNDLPTDTHLLSVGAGTGAEMVFLAKAFPQWRFTAVEPSPPMLAVCRQRAEEAGITARCTFHEGYIDSLPDAPPFDAATCLLVSQFLVQPAERRQLFRQIASRLRPNGYLVSCDLASGESPEAYESLMEVWLGMQAFTGGRPEDVAKMPSAYGRDVAVSPPDEIAAMIAAGGFSTPVLFYQALLIHAWYTRRSAEDTPDLHENR
jgi:tRNA (cmo5U34)-methyltransferase